MIGGVGGVTALFEKYSYTDSKMDLEEYFGLKHSDEVAIVLQDDHIETKAKVLDGIYYLDFDAVQTLLNGRFYEDSAEGLLLYTTPTQIIQTMIGSTTYQQGETEVINDYLLSFYEGEVLYVALDFVQQFTNFSYSTFTEPHRMQLSTKWDEAVVAKVKKKTAVRYKGGVKSEILRLLEPGEQVTILEELENWSRVKTADAFIGYVENKQLKEKETITEIPAAHYQEPEYTSLTKNQKISLGWHQVMVKEANDTFDAVVAKTKGLDVISPTWFSLIDHEGEIRSIASQSYVDRAHEKGLEVWALVDNFDPDISSYEVLAKTSTRTNLINNLMEEVLRYGIDGINVDFEELSYDAGEPFIQFLRELSIQCREKGIVLSVDNYVPRESTAHYNRKEQGIVADYVIIMGYDEHWGGSDAGSVASIGFVEDGIVQTLESVPAKKIINALPFYTRVWKTKNGEVTSEAVSMQTAANFIDNNGIEARWDEETCQYYGELERGGTLYQVWLEDQKSIETKLTVMNRYQLGGVAAWKLGLEDEEVWTLIEAYTDVP